MKTQGLGRTTRTLGKRPDLAKAEEPPVEVGVIEAMNEIFGVHPGFRAVHAKGIVVEGSFRGTGQGAALSRAA